MGVLEAVEAGPVYVVMVIVASLLPSALTALRFTGGSVVFAATGDGKLIALDARTGEERWSVQAGANIAASPMSFAAGGKQFIAIAAARALYTFTLPDPAIP